MSASVEQHRKKLWGNYLAAPDECRHIVNLLAVNWGSLNRAELREALRTVVGPQRAARLEPGEWVGTGLLETETAWSGGERFYCQPVIVELIARALVADGSFPAYVDLARQVAPLGRSYIRNNDDIRFESDDQLIREVRIGLYKGDEAYVAELFDVLKRNRSAYWDGLPERWPGPAGIYAMVCDNPFDVAWFRSLPRSIRLGALPELIEGQLEQWRLDGDAYAMLVDALSDSAPKDKGLRYAAAHAALLRGEMKQARTCLEEGDESSAQLSLKALSLLLGDGLDEAIAGFEAALKQVRKETGTRKSLPDGMFGVLHLLALTLRNQGKDIDEAHKLLELANERHEAWQAYRLLDFALAMECRDAQASKSFLAHLTRLFGSRSIGPWSAWLGLFILHRYFPTADASPYLPKALQIQIRAREDGLVWLAVELGCLIARLSNSRVDFQETATSFEARHGYRLLISRVKHEEPWERALTAIGNVIGKAAEARDASNVAGYRLAWFVSACKSHPFGFDIEPREQKRVGDGWSKGKVLSLKKVLDLANSNSGYLTERDVRLATNIVLDRVSRGYQLTERGWLALVGHPTVIAAETGANLELVLGTPEFHVQSDSTTRTLKLAFWPKLKHEPTLVVLPDGLNRLKLIEIKPEHRKLVAIIGSGIEVPETAGDRVLATLASVSSLVAIQSDISGGELAVVESVEADPKPRVQLTPDGDGLHVAILVRPFGDRGSYLVPGQGSTHLIAEIDGKRRQSQRDIRREVALAEAIAKACPTLTAHGRAVAQYQWLLQSPEDSLEVLLELQGLQDGVEIEWPQGERLRLVGEAGLGQFRLKLQQRRDWFALQGQLVLDDGEVIQMQRLLEAMDENGGRFVRLDENRILALTDAFRKRLEDLRSYSEKHGKEQRVSPLALPFMEEMAEEVGEFEADAAWRRQIERLRQAESHTPRIPSTLQAELRDYQREGFQWLSRLAAWGVGACLADDMGLGKTLQAIGLILSRSAGGPTLVVAPTSVCFNWENEMKRFAPTLRVKALGNHDRERVVEQLGPMDVLLCSYGLLQQASVGELLARPAWQTVVLDEAQAIKNAATKRSKRAMDLRAEFKLITTGTPVENHLGELWSLFRFINPGLLGSQESFNRRFAGPIEKLGDREARQRLKRLIQPFILRRTKAQVLDELPPRTDIELQVELSEQEASFYEALRRNLLRELEGSEEGEEQNFRVLAAITKLRRACCNASLVAPDLGLPCSKLSLFGEVIDELLANRHKALVFSQFVDHLDIIRRFLEAKGVSYQYLDGQTPANVRKHRVEAFQHGVGEVFLISLKAGGTGLNLTAADYVIHMDPWWNPAIEDQASDRAHRIGQQRPVTVYRLITKNTIEEQIVSLHRHKRDLADSLLDGGNMSARLHAEDLLALMRESRNS